MPHKRRTGRITAPQSSQANDEIRTLQLRMAKLGYITSDRRLLVALDALPKHAQSTLEPVTAIALFGPPGTGKTFAAKTFQKDWGADVFLSYQFTPGTTKEELIYDLEVANIATAQAGKWKGTFTKADTVAAGVLTRAFQESQTKRVVLLLDELDKANERVDAFLLSYLNDGEMNAGALGVVKCNPHNLIVFITMNKMRLITEPLMRRCVRRVYLSFPTPDVELRIVHSMAKRQLENLGRPTRINLRRLSQNVITLANEVRAFEKSLKKVPSSPELAAAVFDCATEDKKDWGHTVHDALLAYQSDKELAQNLWGKSPEKLQKFLAPPAPPKPKPQPKPQLQTQGVSFMGAGMEVKLNGLVWNGIAWVTPTSSSPSPSSSQASQDKYALPAGPKPNVVAPLSLPPSQEECEAREAQRYKWCNSCKQWEDRDL